VSAKTATEPRRLRADAARNREALIDAAQRLFTTRGLAVTLDDIAAEAGVNVATAYRHFANKHELARAFLQQIVDEAISIAKDAAAAKDPWQGITDWLTRTLDLMAANRGLHDVFTASYTGEWMETLEQQVNPLLHDLLDRAQRAGKVRRDVSPPDLGVLLQMLAAVTDIDSPHVDVLLRRYLGLVLDGLRPSDHKLPGVAPRTAEVHAAAAASRRGSTGPASRRR
jgi:AcrR family transcriptional regulator